MCRIRVAASQFRYFTSHGSDLTATNDDRIYRTSGRDASPPATVRQRDAFVNDWPDAIVRRRLNAFFPCFAS